MAVDLTEKQSSAATKIAGADANGNETNYIKSTANQDLCVVDLADASGVTGVVAVGITAVAVRVGASNLANRKRLLMINTGAVNVYWGFTNAVTVSNGMILFRNQSMSDAFGPNTTIWVIAASAGSVSIAEAA